MKNEKKIHSEKQNEYEHFNKHELMEKLIPLVENTAMRLGVVPVEIDIFARTPNYA